MRSIRRVSVHLTLNQGLNCIDSTGRGLYRAREFCEEHFAMRRIGHTLRSGEEAAAATEGECENAESSGREKSDRNYRDTAASGGAGTGWTDRGYGS